MYAYVLYINVYVCVCVCVRVLCLTGLVRRCLRACVHAYVYGCMDIKKAASDTRLILPFFPIEDSSLSICIYRSVMFT